MDYLESYNNWMNNNELSTQDRKRLLEITNEEMQEMFYGPLEFGTAGMRGILDVGTNRMNIFTVKRATKGLADFISSLVASFDTPSIS